MRVALGLLVLTGFFLRFARIGESGFNPDEAQFLWVAAADTLADSWLIEKRLSPHPPANFSLLHGILALTWDPMWLRLPSVLCGTYAIWITDRFTRELFGPAAGLSAAFLVAFAPGLVDLSQVCRNYAPVFAVLVTALFFLARFLRTERWSDYVAFALIAPFAVVWNYAAVLVLVGVDAAIGLVLLRRGKPLGWWARAVGWQLPLAAVLLVLYVAHVSSLGETLVYRHESVYGLGSARAWAAPLGLWHYLVKDALWMEFSLLGALGLAAGLARRRFDEVALCAAPLAVAYAAALAGLFPIGPTRHGSPFYPFLLAPVSFLVPELLERTRGSRRLRAVALSGLLLAGGVFVERSLSWYGGDAGWRAEEKREFMTSYPREDVDRAFELLAERAGENDAVILSYQSLYALRLHERFVPIVDPTPVDVRRGDIRIAWPRWPMRWQDGNVRYFYAKELSPLPSPRGLVRALAAVREKHRIPPPDRIWTMRGAWERPLAGSFRRQHHGVAFDEAADADSNGILFAIDREELLKIDPHPLGRGRLTRPRALP